MEMLTNASGRLSLHMPGAQGKAPFEAIDPYLLDTTELDVTDDLYRPENGIAKAQQLMAASAGAANTLMLTGGSTAGIHAMLLYAAQRGDQVILPRNVHISALHLCAVAGLRPVFVPVRYTLSGRPYATGEDYVRTIQAHRDAKGVLVLSPDYYGTLGPVAQAARAAHENGMLLLCDEAHGATMNWYRQPSSAIRQGADLAVQSAHKTLPALTAGAWLHAAEGVDIHLLRRRLRMVQTSSPSFLTMLSLDDARAWMDANGRCAAEKLQDALEHFLAQAAQWGYRNGQAVLPAEVAADPLRLVLDAPQGGFRLAEQLAEMGIDVELSDTHGICCILSLMDGPQRLDKLLDALRSLGPQSADASLAFPKPPAIPERAMPLCEAAFALSEPVAMKDAVGRISAGQVGLYPPGVAVLSAGERITEEAVQWLCAMPAHRLFGLDENQMISCVK